MGILARRVGQGERLILSSVWLTAEITSDNLSTESLAFLLLLKLLISGTCLSRAQSCCSQSQQVEGWEQETSGVRGAVGERQEHQQTPCVRAQDQGRPVYPLPPVELSIPTKKHSNGLLFFKALVNYSYLKWTNLWGI